MQVSEKIFSSEDANRRFRIISEIENARAAAIAKATAMMNEWDEGDSPEASELKLRTFVPSDKELRHSYLKSKDRSSNILYELIPMIFLLPMVVVGTIMFSAVFFANPTPEMTAHEDVVARLLLGAFGVAFVTLAIKLSKNICKEIKSVLKIRKLHGSDDYDKWNLFLKSASAVYLCGNKYLFIAHVNHGHPEVKAIFYDAIHRISVCDDSKISSVMFGRDGSKIMSVPELQCFSWPPENVNFTNGISEMLNLINTLNGFDRIHSEEKPYGEAN